MKGSPSNIKVDMQFERLRTIEQSVNCGSHLVWKCLCSCGNYRLVRASRLICGTVQACAKCSKTAAAARGGQTKTLPENERLFRVRLSIYKQNARSKGHCFELSDALVRALFIKACWYCGETPKLFAGIDRIDSALGYAVSNVVPYCQTCNYAKRKMSQEDFFAWIKRVNAHHFAVISERQQRGAFVRAARSLIATEGLK